RAARVRHNQSDLRRRRRQRTLRRSCSFPRARGLPMIPIVFGALFSLAGLPFLIRGWLFTLKPAHAISLRAKERNMRLGLETDLKRWGRRVRRIGFIRCGIGTALILWGAGVFD